ncbi:MAG: hypothetical protein ACYCT2_06365 [Thermoplasmataceae archaeon]
MRVENDDFSDLVTYFSNLFSLKKMRRIQIDRYGISYESCEIFNGTEINDLATKSDFPDEKEIDRIRTITFSVSGINPAGETKVRISWDSVEMTPDPEKGIADDFMNRLDRSTFRYF